MTESKRKRYENNILLWSGIIGVPLSISIGIFSWMGLNINIWLPVSIGIGFMSGLITYVIFLRGDAEDLKRDNKNLKKENIRLKKEIRKK